MTPPFASFALHKNSATLLSMMPPPSRQKRNPVKDALVIVICMALFYGMLNLLFPWVLDAYDERVLFSAVSGRVLEGGKPVAGATLERSATWTLDGDEPIRDSVKTDSEGRFSFPAITKRKLSSGLLPHEPVISQDIDVRRGNHAISIWYTAKHDYEANGELWYLADGIKFIRDKNKPISITCNLEHERRAVGRILTICNFD
jgi:hypothetical protein